jgi:hypothetical protein
MLEEVEASASIAQSRQRKQKKKKLGQLFYSTPRELEQSRMKKSKVVPRANAHLGNASRTLDFQRTNREDIACRSTWILQILKEEAKAMAIDDANVDKDNHDQVCPKF